MILQLVASEGPSNKIFSFIKNNLKLDNSLYTAMFNSMEMFHFMYEKRLGVQSRDFGLKPSEH